jgi:hypothetical protein
MIKRKTSTTSQVLYELLPLLTSKPICLVVHLPGDVVVLDLCEELSEAIRGLVVPYDLSISSLETTIHDVYDKLIIYPLYYLTIPKHL